MANIRLNTTTVMKRACPGKQEVGVTQIVIYVIGGQGPLLLISVYTTWLEFACSANQHPKSTIKKEKPTDLCAPREFLKQMCQPCSAISKSCYFDYRINKLFTCSRCLICVSCSVQKISTYYVRKGSWTFYLNYPQINEIRLSHHIVSAKSPYKPSYFQCCFLVLNLRILSIHMRATCLSGSYFI